MARQRSSEFGGVRGLIQPLPHPLSQYEEARLERAIDPNDGETTVADQRVKEAGKRGVVADGT